jgi:hypothetical protein
VRGYFVDKNDTVALEPSFLNPSTRKGRLMRVFTALLVILAATFSMGAVFFMPPKTATPAPLSNPGRHILPFEVQVTISAPKVSSLGRLEALLLTERAVSVSA